MEFKEVVIGTGSRSGGHIEKYSVKPDEVDRARVAFEAAHGPGASRTMPRASSYESETIIERDQAELVIAGNLIIVMGIREATADDDAAQETVRTGFEALNQGTEARLQSFKEDEVA